MQKTWSEKMLELMFDQRHFTDPEAIAKYKCEKNLASSYHNITESILLE